MERQLILAILLTFMASFSYAHDAWIEKKDGTFIVVYGHGKDVESYDATKVKEAKAYGADGKIIQVLVEREGYPVMIHPKGTPALITMVFDNGYWVKTLDGWKNKPKKDQPDAVESSHSMKFSKALFRWNDIFSTPVGAKIEIVPRKNPLSLKTGDTFHFQVFLDGKPAQGVSVNASGYHGGDLKTDRDGMAMVTIEKTGFQIVTASIKTPLKNNENADMLSLSANITFELK